jgi:hypothetical protein
MKVILSLLLAYLCLFSTPVIATDLCSEESLGSLREKIDKLVDETYQGFYDDYSIIAGEFEESDSKDVQKFCTDLWDLLEYGKSLDNAKKITSEIEDHLKHIGKSCPTSWEALSTRSSSSKDYRSEITNVRDRFSGYERKVIDLDNTYVDVCL